MHAKEIHECDLCDKKFTMKLLLEKHIIMDTREKPNFCDICQRSFRDVAGLLRHKLIQTRESLIHATFVEEHSVWFMTAEEIRGQFMRNKSF